MIQILDIHNYCNDPKFLDRQVWANSVDPEARLQPDQGLHCLPFCLHLLDPLISRKAIPFQF